ncbi:DUF551 domain-containing protein [Klebsiella phage BUCT_49532]|uniref:DUF551 domain-containing protein n=1 Tax=Klebsiella phage BUCT_49532 TaxID=2849971 RepID=A0A9E6MVQ6_9CAUD|nr:DUF551 domain-containing protein [Klebsiella phage BUCT_49532]QWY14541.1 DUF551 domain-containing protein [Klebsiella phage BUCT_49532]
MRTVTKENLIAQIDRLRKIKDEQGQLSMSGEYTLQAYEMLLPTMEAEPVENHIGSKNALDAIVSFIKSKSNPTVKCYEEVSEQLFKDNCHGIHSHVIEYILKLGEELEDLRAEQAETQPAPIVPDEIPKLKDGRGFKYVKDSVRYSANYANGWNQCRAAMLNQK